MADAKGPQPGIAGDIRDELKKVTWPARSEVIRLTLVVVLISLIIGAYVGGIDFVLAKVLELLTTRR